MCSKCWRDAQTQQKLSVPAAPTLSDAVTSVPVMAPVIAVEVPMESVTTVHEPVKVEADPVPSASDEHAVCTAEGAEGATPARPVQASRNRCFGCNKKVGLLGFECRYVELGQGGREGAPVIGRVIAGSLARELARERRCCGTIAAMAGVGPWRASRRRTALSLSWPCLLPPRPSMLL